MKNRTIGTVFFENDGNRQPLPRQRRGLAQGTPHRHRLALLLLAGVASAAQADWYFRGTPNGWGATALTALGSNQYETCQAFAGGDGNGGPRFKIDRYGNWQEAYPSADYGVGSNKSYRIGFDGASHAITLTDVTSCSGFAKTFTSLNFRGTPNGWANTPMTLVADHIWETTIGFTGASGQRYKLDVYGDWSVNYGDSNADNVLDQNGADIYTNISGSYKLRVNDSTRQYALAAASGCSGSCVNTLGAVYAGDKTVFSLWSPDSSDAQLVLDGVSYPMSAVADFSGYTQIFQVSVSGDQHLKKYYFTVNGVAVRDPYGKMAEPGTNNSIVMDMSRTALTAGWAARPQLPAREDAILYELHVRDFTIDSSSGVTTAKRGKYLGLTEPGTRYNGVKTGLDHLVELGVTHVQLMPVYDFQTCEAVSDSDPCYNWGYDPRNYNVPEERYSLTPTDYENRAREFKQMVDEFHRAGLRVVMDVVYNHTFDKQMLQPITAKYYTATDLSGTGNSLDADQPMVSRMIRDSLEYWLREYNIDGFRFDLIGIFDYDEVGAWAEYLNNQFPDRNLLMYGEPWNGFAADAQEGERVRLGTIGRIASSHVGVFNPKYREAIKGQNDNGSCNPGDCFAFNAGPDTWRIEVGGRGALRASNNASTVIDTWDPMFALDPEQAINYVSAHDNLALRDKILAWAAQNGRSNSDPYLRRIQQFANGVILTSQGIPFLHGGEELMRDKQGNHNSYNAGDEVNKFRWEWKVSNADIFAYYKQLIALRKAHSGLRLNSWNAINSNVTSTRPRYGVVVHRINSGANGDSWPELIVIQNSADNYSHTLPAGNWKVAVEKSDPAAGNGRSVTGSVIAEGTAVTVLYRE